MHYTFFPGARFCVQNDMTISSVIKKKRIYDDKFNDCGKP